MGTPKKTTILTSKTLLSKTLPSNPKKEEVISLLQELKSLGWVEGRRAGNDGSVGNTIEDYLGIKENNLQTADAGEWEIKSQRKSTSSMITLFHLDPQPRKPSSIVANHLVPKYGWAHKSLPGEMSFRVTICGARGTERGLCVKVDRKAEKVLISFTHSAVDARHKDWLSGISKAVGLMELNPQPYWTFDELRAKAQKKIKNTFFVEAEVKIESGKEHFKYDKILELSKFDFDKFLNCIESGIVLIDFDARTGHNHGTKFRIKQNAWPNFFDSIKEI